MEQKGTYYSVLGLYRDSGNGNGNYYVSWGYIGIMEQKGKCYSILGQYWVMEKKGGNIG